MTENLAPVSFVISMVSLILYLIYYRRPNRLDFLILAVWFVAAACYFRLS